MQPSGDQGSPACQLCPDLLLMLNNLKGERTSGFAGIDLFSKFVTKNSILEKNTEPQEVTGQGATALN